MRDNELIVYRDFENGSILHDMIWVMENYQNEEFDWAECRAVFYDCIHRLIEEAGVNGFYGNLWHCYLTNLLVNNENSYSMACEIKGNIEGTINKAVLHDIEIFKELYDYDFTDIKEKLKVEDFSLLENYEGCSQESKVYNLRIRDRICDLAAKFKHNHTPNEMKDTLTEFYREYGVGKFGLHKSFRIANKNGEVYLEPILNIAHVYFDDLIGYEIAKKKIKDNTDAFVNGQKTNNCLLYGDAGTGKSSSIKAIANEYYERGLRIIEVYKHQFQDLNAVISQIKNRNYKFIIFMDDLSFEDFEIEYKYLKAVIEGGLEKKPKNVLIYATSNRRHLVRERFSDKEDRRDDLHSGDTVQEKLSLASRFGVQVFFGSPSPKEFKEIVKGLAQRNSLSISDEELLAEANKWEVSHGGLSGRCAQQFIDYIATKI